jgi:leader peptidase (prepilin peptidase)/N-methyltransferase
MAVLLNDVFGSPILFLILGLVMGSFGNVLLHRLPKNESILGRSHCPQCRKNLGVFELIPILSYIVLRGRCRNCGKPISLHYPLIELASGTLFLLSSAWNGFFPHAVLLALSLWLLLLIGVTDAQTGYIPDALNIPFIVSAIFYTTLVHSFPLQGILVGVAPFAFQWILSRGRWVGSGDVFLSIGIGALMGTWQMTLLWLWLSYVSGALIAVFLLWMKLKKIKGTLPFGPFMAGSAVVIVFVGEYCLSLFF